MRILKIQTIVKISILIFVVSHAMGFTPQKEFGFGYICEIMNTGNSTIPSNKIVDIAIDSSLNVWIATPAGLGRYAGGQWTVYDTSNSDLPNNNLRRLQFDRMGNLWIVSSGNDSTNGLIKFDGKTFTLFNSSNTPMPNNHICDMDIDNSDNIWLAPYTGKIPGLIKFDGDEWTLYEDEGIRYIWVIAHDSDNIMWLGSYGGGFTRFDGRNFSGFDKCPFGYFQELTQIAVDNYNHVWFTGLSTGHKRYGILGLGRFDGRTWVVYRTQLTDFAKLKNNTRRIKIDSKDNKWILDNGIVIFNDYPSQLVWHQINSSNSNLPTTSPTDIEFARDDVWAGTPGKGICLFRDLKVSVSRDLHKRKGKEYTLYPNYPNPFNPSTTIQYDLSPKGYVELRIIDLLGRQVRTLVSEEKSAGSHQVTWNGQDDSGHRVASGVYLYRMTVEGYTGTRKLLLTH